MAYTQSDFVKDLALYSAGATIGVTRSRKMLEYAAKKGIQLGGLALRRGAVPAARAAVAIPGRHLWALQRWDTKLIGADTWILSWTLQPLL